MSITTYTPVTGVTIDGAHTEMTYNSETGVWRFDDGCAVPQDIKDNPSEHNAQMKPQEWEQALLAPIDNQEPADPLQTWADSLEDADAVRARMWARADAAADVANACSEYEQTVAWPAGHEGRDGMREEAGEGEVVLERVITLVQRTTVNVGADEEPEEVARYADYWDTYDEEEESIEVLEDYRESAEVADPPPLADLVRRALEDRNTSGSWAPIRDALLSAAQEAGCPITVGHSAGVAGTIALETVDRYGEWSAYEARRYNDVEVSTWEAESLTGTDVEARYRAALRVIAKATGQQSRVAFPTLAATVSRDWSVTA